MVTLFQLKREREKRILLKQGSAVTAEKAKPLMAVENGDKGIYSVTVLFFIYYITKYISAQSSYQCNSLSNRLSRWEGKDVKHLKPMEEIDHPYWQK